MMRPHLGDGQLCAFRDKNLSIRAGEKARLAGSPATRLLYKEPHSSGVSNWFRKWLGRSASYLYNWVPPGVKERQ